MREQEPWRLSAGAVLGWGGPDRNDWAARVVGHGIRGFGPGSGTRTWPRQFDDDHYDAHHFDQHYHDGAADIYDHHHDRVDNIDHDDNCAVDIDDDDDLGVANLDDDDHDRVANLDDHDLGIADFHDHDDHCAVDHDDHVVNLDDQHDNGAIDFKDNISVTPRDTCAPRLVNELRRSRTSPFEFPRLPLPDTVGSIFRKQSASRRCAKARRVVRQCFSGLVVAVVLGTLAPTAQQRLLVLEGGTLIDGTGRAPVADALVVVEGNRIKAVGTRGQLSYPPSATVLRLNGRTILPGLIDGHVHLRDYQPPMFLPYGVTTIADIHNDTAWSIAQRDALRTGKIKGPRLFVSGARVTGPGGRVTTDGSYVKDVPEARAYVRSLVKAGVDHIKVDLTITDEQLKAVIEEANAANVKALGHTQNIKKAVDMGFRHMEHMDTMARALLEQEGKNPRPEGTTPEATVDPKLFPPLIDYMVKQGVYVNPVLVLTWNASTQRWRDQVKDAAEIVKNPGLAFVPADVKAAWVREPGRQRPGYEHVAEFLRKYSEAGGKVLAATDTGCCVQIVPGLSLHYEMQMLTDLGIPPMKAIQGATLWAAEVIGQDKDLGSVQAGKLADFTIVEGNPLADIGATKNVRMVIKDGQVIDTSYDPKWVNPVPRQAAPPPSTAPR